MAKRFVVHRHHVTHLHFDFRLEKEGVLKSWAVPKGLPDKAGVKRLAVQTPDHPLDYIDFKGVIPEGEYGAGTVEIWDKGGYELESWEVNKAVFRLNGNKLKGWYALVHMGGKNWLIMKLKKEQGG